jgi:formylglycine-generating enzyme required for sulfatase activity
MVYMTFIGNVWEWTDDCVTGKRGGEQINGCYARGGSWDNYIDKDVHSKSELFKPMIEKEPTIGFRIAREMEPGEHHQNAFRACDDDTCPVLVEMPQGDGRKALAVGRNEVTFKEWNACVDDKGNRFACTSKPDDQNWPGSGRPVICVNFSDARAYLDWLSDKTGQRYRYRLLSPARNGMTLPIMRSKLARSRLTVLPACTELVCTELVIG